GDEEQGGAPMMRLPFFRYVAPRTVSEAASLLADAEPGEAMLLAGGTDLLPNMKRRQQVPRLIIGLRKIAEMRRVENGRGLRLGRAIEPAAPRRLIDRPGPRADGPRGPCPPGLRFGRARRRPARPLPQRRDRLSHPPPGRDPGGSDPRSGGGSGGSGSGGCEHA